MVEVKGVLYGTTFEGGAGDGRGGTQVGTVYTISADGAERVLHSFIGGASDGAYPHAALLNVNGIFYGTTEAGGTYNGGTVYSITPSGTEQILHSFGAPGDGADPVAGLIEMKGLLYGATAEGGKGKIGTVYSITPDGVEQVMYSFRVDGTPGSSLVAVNGTLFGTTAGTLAGLGSVFSITPSGTFHRIYNFKGSPDGSVPEAALTEWNGSLYGTTYNGGIMPAEAVVGNGTVFTISR